MCSWPSRILAILLMLTSLLVSVPATAAVGPPTPASLTLNPTTVTGGATSTGTVILTGPAPSSGLVVGLSSNNAVVSTVPTKVTVPAGATTATFQVSTNPVAAIVSVVVSASSASVDPITRRMIQVIKTATLTVSPLSLSSITLNPSSVTGGASVTGTVSLTGPPLKSAVSASVTLFSSNPVVAMVPRSVMFRGGASPPNFNVTTNPVAAPADVTISASYAGVTIPATLRVVPPALTSLGLSASSVTGGASVTGTVTLTGPAPSSGAAIGLFPLPQSPIATVPSSVTIPAGATNATFTISTASQTQTRVITIHANYKDLRKSANLTVVPATLDSVKLKISESFYVIVAGVQGGVSVATGEPFVAGKVILTGPAPPGGAVVTLSSSNQAAATLPGFIQVPAGSVETGFNVTVYSVAADTTATISASYAGQTRAATVRLYPPGLDSLRLNSTSVTGGTPVTGTVYLFPAGGVAPSGGLVASLSSSNQAAATVPATIMVPAGANSASLAVTTYPVGQQANVRIAATMPHGTASQTKEVTLAVLPPALKELGFNPTGASYQAGWVDGSVSLTGPAPAGAAVLLSWTSTAPATAPSSVPVAAGATSATFKVSLKPVTAATPFTLSAYYGGVTKTATLTVTP